MTTALDAAALLRAIVTDPADDLPRLAYADWLEENGQPERAEFIRCQITASIAAQTDPVYCRRCGWAWDACSCPVPTSRVAINNRRADVLLMANRRWELEEAEASWWERGFVWKMACPLAAWLEHGPALVLAHPITSVRATDKEPRAWRTSSFGPDHYHWVEGYGDGARGRHEVPADIHRRLVYPEGEPLKCWDNADDANAALGAALVNLARKAAGLPPLEGKS